MNRSDNYHKFIKFRKQFKMLTYESYDLKINKNYLEASYNFNLDKKYYFRPSLYIPLKSFIINDNLSEEKLRNIVFNIGMVELISYWKSACPPYIVIKPYHLNQEQKQWWKNLYFNGMGEFFYLNSINTTKDDFVQIISESEDFTQKGSFYTENSVVIPVGGGKDSTVTLELLDEPNKNNLLLMLNPRKSCMDTAYIAGYDESRIIEVNRTLDPALLKMNDEGFLNGHTPFSALLAFISLLCAAISGKKNIALSNESSANESTVEGSPINHQYSKSFEFEKDFRNYYFKYITEDINYFSFLRPINELQIAKLFAKNPKYFQAFRSCNAGSKTNIWCGNCPKCLFIFIILSPFIERKKMIEIFGKDILDDKNLLHQFNQLTGAADTKPFECVGTIEEVNAALNYLIKINHGNLSFLLDYYSKNKSSCYSYDNDFSTLLIKFNNEHFLNKYFEDILKKNLYD